jgi:hypothetical protein
MSIRASQYAAAVADDTVSKASSRRVVRSLLDLDEELAATVPEADREEARRMVVGAQAQLPCGAARPYDLAHVSALYVSRGALLREVTLGTVALPEIISGGDFLRPRPVTDTLGWGTVSLQAIEPVTLLALDERFGEATARWPALRATVEQRGAERHHRALLLGAIGHLPRVDQRVIALLWLFATEWGRIAAEGLFVPFPLTHAAIGRFIGAARSTVTLAITDLTTTGLIRRRPDGAWLLPSESEPAARELLGVSDQMPVLGLGGRTLRRRSAELGRKVRRTIEEAANTAEEAALARGRSARPRTTPPRGT